MVPLAPDDLSSDARARIVAATAHLIHAGGVAAATTRAVANAAGVQVPTIYRLFGDKRGLLDAVAEAGLAAYVSEKARRTPGNDPVEELGQAWDDHVAFCLAHPAIFALMSSIGPDGRPSAAAEAGLEVLRQRIRRVAQAGRLRVSEERAVDLVHACGTGVIGVLLGKVASERGDLAAAARETVMTAIIAGVGSEEAAEGREVASLASGVRARIDEADMLSPGERLLLDELLRRIAGG
ncbi:TetR/AcrR family transcriptional regulator [Sphingomonas aracearum]|uniref:TetR/AcrR family transcriptional regulator n=1 Tax=Sphingomonas aracearum TaxID=2283317 RepID=A0A369VZZ1_9SPHN|nr:TetR/AcrR family transcriptional regulator [Sphingomonas aracearum]RDE07369.1 TetR/AcrR family transcriptional regulator [Sphingomonas aracearum]